MFVLSEAIIQIITGTGSEPPLFREQLFARNILSTFSSPATLLTLHQPGHLMPFGK
jgi:hypothetical protein